MGVLGDGRVSGCGGVCVGVKGKSKGSSYIVQYPVLRTIQSALHFTSLTDLFTQIPSRLLLEAYPAISYN